MVSIASCSSDKSTSNQVANENVVSEQSAPTQINSENLMANKWELVSFVCGSDVKQSAVIIEFDASSLAGNTGCNTLMAKYTLNGSKISIYDVATTKVACPKDKAEFEVSYLKALSEELDVEISEDGTLVLKNVDKGIEIKYNKIN